MRTAFGFALLVLFPAQNALAQCQLQCQVTTEDYKIDLTCEKGPVSEKVSDQTSYEHTPTGTVGALVLNLNRERTYSASKRTYHIAGTIRINKTAGTTTYDIQATGGLLGSQTASCKAANARASAPVAPGAPRSVPPAPSRDRTVNLRVAAEYQPTVVVPACLDALKKEANAAFACMVSEPREYIGQGKTWRLPSQIPPASAEAFFERVTVTVPDAQGPWRFDFSTPQGTAWRTGLFDGVMRDGFHDSEHAGLSISGQARGCSEVGGRFEVLELVSDADGRKIQKFAVNFEQICSGRRLQGIVRFNSSTVSAVSATGWCSFSCRAIETAS